MLKATVQRANPGLHGFDVNSPLSIAQAQAMKESYDFVVRYIPRTPVLAPGNISALEAQNLLNAGLSLLFVQHVPLPNWMPTSEIGSQYGAYAAQYVKQELTAPFGVTVFCDLEMVSKSATNEDVIGYLKNWCAAVTLGGYQPGLYVGFQPGLSPEQLYADLPFKHYWRAYNGDQVAKRGYQLVQHDQVTVHGLQIDPNTTQLDEMGDSVIWLSPA